MVDTGTAQTTDIRYREDYQPPPYRVDEISLRFELGFERTRVHTRMRIRRTPDTPAGQPLELDGEGLELHGLWLDGVPPAGAEQDARRLCIPAVPGDFVLETEHSVFPEANQDLLGLYRSERVLCSQCEPEAFRRIAFYPDRPDVLARFRVRLEGERSVFPVLLSNGQRVAEGSLGDKHHFAEFVDPVPRPAYLFALVAGRLEPIEEEFHARDGRRVALRLWSEETTPERGRFALQALKRAMRFDEEEYGRDYHLDCLELVGVTRYTMGAMENTGLHLYSDRRLLADPDTATDGDFRAVEGLVGHEYFHHWTGNRVTLRDWFQVALKEGFTVYREQCFAARRDPLRRVRDARALRATQFAEDAGPLAHAPRPRSMGVTGNAFSDTVYLKGAELIRMCAHRLGRDGFRRACEAYFERHDGRAVTVEDFLECLAGEAGEDLHDMRAWFDLPGTPRLRMAIREESEAGERRLRIQRLAAGTGDRRPIPVAIDDRLGSSGEDPRPSLWLTGEHVETAIPGGGESPTPALNPGFAAPVLIETPESPTELAERIAAPGDAWLRRDAVHRLAADIICADPGDRDGEQAAASELLEQALARVLDETAPERPGLAAQLLELPGFTELSAPGEVLTGEIDPERLLRARAALHARLARGLAPRLHDCWRARRGGANREPEPGAMAERELANVCLDYLAATPGGTDCAREQYAGADNLTDRLAALGLILEDETEDADAWLASWEELARHEPFLMDRWFSLQAASFRRADPEHLRNLCHHPGFSDHWPHRVRGLLASFCHENPARFHAADGSGYVFLAERIQCLDAINPPLAAELLRAFAILPRLVAPMRERMHSVLTGLAEQRLSPDCAEIAATIRANAGR